MKRRDFITIAATTAVGAILKPSSAWAESIDLKSARAEIKPKPLPFSSKKLNGISERMIQSHWENNYIGSVKALNSVNKKLAEIALIKDSPPFVYGGLKREHLLRTGSVVFHDLYFGNLGGDGKMSLATQKIISNEFGSDDLWENDFKRTALSLSGASGWVILGFNTHLGIMENYWSSDHMHAPASTLPLLVMDMYEHSYQIDFGAQAAKYIDAFFKNINWDEVAARIERAKKVFVVTS